MIALFEPSRIWFLLWANDILVKDVADGWEIDKEGYALHKESDNGLSVIAFLATICQMNGIAVDTMIGGNKVNGECENCKYSYKEQGLAGIWCKWDNEYVAGRSAHDCERYEDNRYPLGRDSDNIDELDIIADKEDEE